MMNLFLEEKNRKYFFILKYQSWSHKNKWRKPDYSDKTTCFTLCKIEIIKHDMIHHIFFVVLTLFIRFKAIIFVYMLMIYVLVRSK